MTQGILESLTVTSLPDLDGVPPCELVWDTLEGVKGKPCGKPSSGRWRLRCLAFHSEHIFLCPRCFELVKKGRASCTTCGGYICDWKAV